MMPMRQAFSHANLNADVLVRRRVNQHNHQEYEMAENLKADGQALRHWIMRDIEEMEVQGLL